MPRCILCLCALEYIKYSITMSMDSDSLMSLQIMSNHPLQLQDQVMWGLVSAMRTESAEVHIFRLKNIRLFQILGVSAYLYYTWSSAMMHMNSVKWLPCGKS